tara:strand:+ start:1718 stop:2584 length:867 start_codon:yes stop_codon:yes gene_type:complete
MNQNQVNEIVAFDWSTLPMLIKDKGIDLGIDFTIRLATALAIFLIGKFVIKLIINAISKIMARQTTDRTLELFICNLVNISLMVVVIIASIGALGIETTSFIAIFGAAGLAIGLALQGSLSNFASGVLIVLFKPYRVDDFIEAAGISGIVEKVQILTTILKTVDNKQIIVPNSKIMDSIITNYSTKETRRIDMKISVGYQDDIDFVKKTLYEIISEDKRILTEPKPMVVVSELADSSVNFVIRTWVNSEEFWDIKFEMIETIKKSFDKKGISFPYPQQDVHIYQKNDA